MNKADIRFGPLRARTASWIVTQHHAFGLFTNFSLYCSTCRKSRHPGQSSGYDREGQQRAQALKEALKSASIDVIIVSDLQRTRLTAQPLADYLGLQPVVIALRPPSNPDQYIQNVVKEITDNWKGRDVLVVSHNTLIQQIAKNLEAARRLKPLMRQTAMTIFSSL